MCCNETDVWVTLCEQRTPCGVAAGGQETLRADCCRGCTQVVVVVVVGCLSITAHIVGWCQLCACGVHQPDAA